MKWIEEIKFGIIRVIRRIFKVIDVNIPVESNTGLIDNVRVKNICLHLMVKATITQP